MAKKNKVREKVQEYFDITGTTEEVLSKIATLSERYGDSWEITFEWDGYDGGENVTLWNNREETDSEYEKRMADLKKKKEKAAVAKQKKEERERAQLEKLKKKYG